ncbi:glutamate receptor 2.9-like [Phalaenopsis equestris]|uniref:glutamate receptor 2.9-like n=1 Tax=Phalaenopsis equestris TaxID=78828 RepID=UPI0009E3BB3A|nr:glutamate receptor 2.9-like [Phalaenopsis equestris]
MTKKGRKPQRHPFCLVFLLSLVLRAEAQVGGEGVHGRIQIDVGVILDVESWIGNISLSCMRMAVEDFYAVNSGYSTRISLHLRDSGGDAFGAASAAIDLLNNVKVKAIIGPQQSSQASFVMNLGDRARVPILSFSAKSPSLSSKQSSYFLRTAYNDSTQAKAIASIVKYFNWREVVLIYVDDEYGNGIMPYLINQFQHIDVRVPRRSSIPPSATESQILKELNKLKNMQTRVFVVHMTCELGLKFFKIAKEEGMLNEGYVWITTYGLTDVVNLMGSSAANVMQGVLGVRPLVNMTSKLRDFKQRWRKIFHEENPESNINEPIVFGLWAYDTVWALALAAEKVRMENFEFRVGDMKNSSNDIASIGSSSVGPKLLSAIQSTEFDGMAGRFRLIDGQLESQDIEIVNVVKNGSTRIGFWAPPNNVSGRRNSKDKLDVVVWPGGREGVPKGWEWPTAGNKLKIGVPVKPGFPEVIRVELDPDTNKRIPKGYCIDVFDAVMKNLTYAPYDYVLYEDGNGQMNGTYDDLVYQVYLQNYDAVVGDVTIIANRSLYVDFTLPYTESGVSMLVPINDNRKKDAWAFLDPLTTDLWLASGAFFIFTGFVVWLIEHRINPEFRGEPTEQLGTVLYFSFSTLVFAHRERVVSNLSRLVVIVWLFVVLVLQSSYTASLSSMLTVQQLQPTVTDMNDLIKNGNRVGYLVDSFMPSLLERLNFEKANVVAYSSPEEYNEAMSNGSVAAIVDELPYLKIFLNKYCGKYAMVGTTYKTDGFGFAFPKHSPLVSQVSAEILRLLDSTEMVDIENILYDNRSCPTQDENDTNSSSLSFRSFWGLFLITGVASFACLVFSLANFIYKHTQFLQTSDLESSIRKKVVFWAKLFDQMDSSDENKTAGAKEEEEVGDATIPVDVVTTAAISGPPTPSSISNYAIETSESEEEIEASSDEEEEEASGREISRQNPDPPSFAYMVTARDPNEF